MSGYLSGALAFVKRGGKLVADLTGFGAGVGAVEAAGYYYASVQLNGILQRQFQQAGWPASQGSVAANDLASAISFARDQYYAKAIEAGKGAGIDVAKNFAFDWGLALVSGGTLTLGKLLLQWGVQGVQFYDEKSEAVGKLRDVYNDTVSAGKTVPDGPAKTAATTLVSLTWGTAPGNMGQRALGKRQAAVDAIYYILGSEYPFYTAKSGFFATYSGAVNRIAAWVA